MNKTASDLIYLLSCSVNGITPDKSRVQSMDLEELYYFSMNHSVQAAVCLAIEKAGVKNEKFHDAYIKAFGNNAYHDIERKAILADFEKQGIWYMPLKGIILKDIYPKSSFRQMSDNDILFDAKKQYQVKDIMEAHGYTTESIGKYQHDIYTKPPVLHFELHTELFYFADTEHLYKYYSDVKRLMKKDEGSDYSYHFSDDDNYVFVTAHEWKHFSSNGTGIRSLLDAYVYCKVKGDKLDWDYITEQCKQLKISDFEHKRRELALKIFSSEKLPELNNEENNMLMLYLDAGTYGKSENKFKHDIEKMGKFSFWIHSIFIPRETMNYCVPFTAKSPLLYPVGVICRCINLLLFNRNKIKTAIKLMKKKKD